DDSKEDDMKSWRRVTGPQCPSMFSSGNGRIKITVFCLKSVEHKGDHRGQVGTWCGRALGWGQVGSAATAPQRAREEVPLPPLREHGVRRTRELAAGKAQLLRTSALDRDARVPHASHEEGDCPWVESKVHARI